MKKTLILLSLLSIVLSPEASACALKISTGQDAPKSGTADVITVQLIQIHRNCAVAPDATEFEADGLKITDSSEWKAIRDNVHERTFQVEYEKSGTAVFKAKRSCQKKGNQVKALEIQVQ